MSIGVPASRVGSRRGTTAALIASASVFSLTLGLTYPLLALSLEAAGASKALIGVNAAMTPLGLVLSAPLIPRVARAANPFRFLVSCVLTATVLLLLIAAIRDVHAWMLLRLLLGCAVNGLFIVGETSIMKVAGHASRGRVMGAYNAFITLGYAIGPLLVAGMGSAGWLPFAVAIGMMLAATTPLLVYRSGIRAIELGGDGTSSISSFLPKAPVLVAGAASTALFDNASMSLLPIYGLERGLDERTGTAMLAVALLGGMALQYPIGWAADRASRRWVLIGCGLLSVGGCAVLPAVFAIEPLRWITLFLWGGAALGVYTVVLAELGHRFFGAMLVAGNAALAITWGVSSMAGVPIAGLAMDRLGPNGWMLVLGVAFALVVVLAVGARRSWACGDSHARGAP